VLAKWLLHAPMHVQLIGARMHMQEVIGSASALSKRQSRRGSAPRHGRSRGDNVRSVPVPAAMS
jgi:hypothetical protein